MNRRKRIIGVALGLAVPLLGVLCWQVDRHFRQEQRNHALIAAIRAQDRTRVLELLDAGADANACDTGEIPSFTQAIRLLIDQVGRHDAQAGGAPFSALLRASLPIHGTISIWPDPAPHYSSPPDEEIALALLDHGANPNGAEEEGHQGVISPVGLALINHQYRLLRRLLERGANPNAKAAEYIEPDGSTLCVRPLVAAFALDRHDSEGIRLLIEHGAEVNAADSNGDTPLMEAAQVYYPEGVVWLLQHGAKPGMQNKQGETALSLALTRAKQLDNAERRMIVALLKQYGATK